MSIGAVLTKSPFSSHRQLMLFLSLHRLFYLLPEPSQVDDAVA